MRHGGGDHSTSLVLEDSRKSLQSGVGLNWCSFAVYYWNSNLQVAGTLFFPNNLLSTDALWVDSWKAMDPLKAFSLNNANSCAHEQISN